MPARILSALILLTLCVPALAQQPILPRPTVLAVFPAGGKAGETFELEITEQSELEEADSLIFSHPGISAQPKMTEPDRFYPEPRKVPNTFVVSIAPNTPPGVYELRAQVGSAISNARRFVVGDLPEILEEEENNSPEQANEASIGSVINGRFNRDYDFFRFHARQRERLIIHCQSQRIDSRGDSVLRLQDAAGRELARSHNAIGFDSVLDFQAPAEGDYFLRVHDLTFTSAGGAGTSPYRITLADRPWVDFADPPVLSRGQSTSVTLYGSNLGGADSGIVWEGRKLEKLTVNITAPAASAPDPRLAQPLTEGGAAWFYYRHPTGKGQSNPVAIALAENPLTGESEPNDQLEQSQQLSLPADLIGRFDRAGDVDSYTFEAKKGEKLAISVQSQELGQLADPVLVVQRLLPQQDGGMKTQDLSATDDVTIRDMNFRLSMFSADPDWVFEAPEEGKYRVLVRDQFNAVAAGRPVFYRLSVGPPRADFHLVAAPDLEFNPDFNNNQQLQPRSAVVRRGGSLEILVFAHRTAGFAGEIELKVEGLPGGVTADPAVIGPDRYCGTIVIRAPQNAAAWMGPLRIIGSAKVENQQIVRPAYAAEMLWQMNNNDPTPARLAETIMLAVDDQMTLPARVEPAVTTLRMSRGGKLSLPLKLVKQTEWSGDVTVAAVGLPREVSKNTANVNASGNEGKLELDIQQNAEPGRYSLFLRGEAEIDFRRQPQLEERALADRDRINQVKQELEKEYQQAVQNRQAAERALQESVQNKNNAENQKNQAAQLAQQTEQQSQQTAQQALQAKTAAEEASKRKDEAAAKLPAAPDENAKNTAQSELNQATQQAEQAQAAYAAAEKQAAEAAAKAKEAAEKQAEAEKKLAEMIEANKLAETARTETLEKENQGRTDRDLGEQKRQRAEQILRDAQNIARQRKIKVPAHSQMIALQIVPFPVETSLSTTSIKLQAGTETDLTARVKREFDFNGELNIQIQPPPGIGGWSLSQNAKIPADQNEGKFQVRIDKNSPPGQHQGELILRMNFNNRQLEQRLPLAVVVDPPAAE